MFNYLKKSFMNLKIRYKILLSMIIMSLVTAAIISYSSYSYYVNYSLKEATYEIEKSIDIITLSLNEDISDMYSEVSFFLTDPLIKQIINDSSNNNDSNYIKHYIDAQDSLNSAIRNNNLLKYLVLLGNNGEFYSTFNLGLSHRTESPYLFNEKDSKSVIWNEIHQNPLTNENDYVIPISFPIKKNYYNTFSFFLSDNDELAANLYVFIDVLKLDNYISQMNKNADSTIVCYNYNKNPMSLYPSSKFYSLSTHPKVIDYLNDVESPTSIDLTIDGEEYMITKSYFGINGFTLVNFISKTQLLAPLNQLRIKVIQLFWISILLSIFLSFLVSKTITTPLKSLMNLVKDIGKGNYRTSDSYAYNDETGLLREGLNSMSSVIIGQIEIIKIQEQENSNAEIDILTQQINPHFIYNTLDYIRWEILGENKVGAANMIESLAVFLRLGLNQGSRLITIKQEISRISEYLLIINNRQDSDIQIDAITTSDIENRKILILILQPLIENCIKHAFDDSTKMIVRDPRIRVEFAFINRIMTIVVEDNGKGMDINKMNTLIQQKHNEPSPHVGIKNVYLRFKSYYGDDAKMTFESTPFYRNTVTLTFKPLPEN